MKYFHNEVRIFGIVAILLLLFASRIMLQSKPPDLSEPVKVQRVIDGDTIEVSGGVTIRLIGVDTPESVHPDKDRNTDYGKIASEYTTNLLAGKMVQLEYDVERYDSYDRILAYVYLDGEMVNETLLRNGMARSMSISPNTKYASRFRSLEQDARMSNVGFWASYFSNN